MKTNKLDLVLPWELKKIQKTKDAIPTVILNQIINNLISGEYELKRWIKNMEVPNKQTVKAIKEVCIQLETIRLGASDRDIPWIIVISNQHSLLSSLSQLLPITYALSVRCGVRTVTTDCLLRLLSGGPFPSLDDSEFFSNPSSPTLDRIYLAALLFWHHWAVRVNPSKVPAALYPLLEHRLSKKLPMVFTWYIPSEITTVPLALKRMATESLCLGNAVSNLILENSLVCNLRSQSYLESKYSVRTLDI